MQAQAADAQRRYAEAERATATRERVRAEAEAQAAEIERQRADQARKTAEASLQVAQTERTRADRRTGQLAELGNKSLFEVHDAIAKLPRARKCAVRSRGPHSTTSTN